MAHAVELPPTAAAVTSKPARLFFLDRIRVALTMLVVVHHAAVTYSDIPLWYYNETPKPGTPGLLDLLLVANQAFFMGMFFMISAFFVPGSYERKGPKAFLRDRLLRLGVPLLAFYFVLSPVANLLGNLGMHRSLGGSWWDAYLNIIGAGPLWFAEALIAFTVGYVVWRQVAKTSAVRTERTAEPLSYAKVGLFVAVLGVVTYLWRIVVPQGMWIPFIDFPSAAFLPQYLGLFVVGLLAYQRGWLTTPRPGMGWVGGAAALVGLAVDVAMLLGGHGSGGPGVQAFVGALGEAVFCVGICLALLSLFRATARKEGLLGRYLSAHSFTVYIIHAPVLVAVTVAMHAFIPTGSALANFALAALITVPLTYALAYPVRKLPLARKVL